VGTQVGLGELLLKPLAICVLPVAWIFATLTRLRVWLFKRGTFKSVRPSMPCLSIGNIRAGGTGKTPLLFDCVQRMQQEQLRVGVLSRGYGGDEGRILEQRLPQVELVENPDRVTGLTSFKSSPQVIVLDDGFQHLRVQRDLDVVLLDATRPFGHCFPSGLFREPLSALRRADLVIVSRASLVSQLKLAEIWQKVKSLRSGLAEVPQIEGDVAISRVVNINNRQEFANADLNGACAFVSCGIGNPNSFISLCENAGVKVCGSNFLADHSPWSDSDIQRCQDHKLVLVTEKDAVKLQGRALDNMFSVKVDWQFSAGERAWEAALEQLLLPIRAARIEPLWQAHQENSAR